MDDGLHLTVPRLLLAQLPWPSALTWNGSLLHPAQLFLGLLCCACLFCPHQVFCEHFPPLLPECFMAGAIGRALAVLSRWQPVSPVHTLGSRWTVLQDMTPCVCVCTPVEQNSSTNHSSGSKPAEKSPPAGCIPDPWPLRTDFHWVLTLTWHL